MKMPWDKSDGLERGAKKFGTPVPEAKEGNREIAARLNADGAVFEDGQCEHCGAKGKTNGFKALELCDSCLEKYKARRAKGGLANDGEAAAQSGGSGGAVDSSATGYQQAEKTTTDDGKPRENAAAWYTIQQNVKSQKEAQDIADKFQLRGMETKVKEDGRGAWDVWVRELPEKSLGNASDDAGKCFCGDKKRDQEDPKYHTPGSDRCKQIADLKDFHDVRNGKENAGRPTDQNLLTKWASADKEERLSMLKIAGVTSDVDVHSRTGFHSLPLKVQDALGASGGISNASDDSFVSRCAACNSLSKEPWSGKCGNCLANYDGEPNGERRNEARRPGAKYWKYKATNGRWDTVEAADKSEALSKAKAEAKERGWGDVSAVEYSDGGWQDRDNDIPPPQGEPWDQESYDGPSSKGDSGERVNAVVPLRFTEAAWGNEQWLKGKEWSYDLAADELVGDGKRIPGTELPSEVTHEIIKQLRGRKNSDAPYKPIAEDAGKTGESIRSVENAEGLECPECKKEKVKEPHLIKKSTGENRLVCEHCGRFWTADRYAMSTYRANTLENAGHLASEPWAVASADERMGWLISASQDADLARFEWADLSMDAQKALQDVWDMPASRNEPGGDPEPQDGRGQTTPVQDRNFADEPVIRADMSRDGEVVNADGRGFTPKMNADDKGPFDQPNKLGCNGCDAIKPKLNKDGYCKECAAQQGPRQNAYPDETKEFPDETEALLFVKKLQGSGRAHEIVRLADGRVRVTVHGNPDDGSVSKIEVKKNAKGDACPSCGSKETFEFKGAHGDNMACSICDRTWDATRKNAGKCAVCKGRGYGGNGARCEECGGSGNANAVEPKENAISESQWEELARGYEKLRGIDPSSPNGAKFLDTIHSADDDTIRQLAAREIKFVSMIARNEMSRRGLKNSTDWKAKVAEGWKQGKSIAEMEKELGITITHKGNLSDLHKDLMGGNFEVRENADDGMENASWEGEFGLPSQEKCRDGGACDLRAEEKYPGSYKCTKCSVRVQTVRNADDVEQIEREAQGILHEVSEMKDERKNTGEHTPTGKKDGGFDTYFCPEDGLAHRKMLGADGKSRCGACDKELKNAITGTELVLKLKGRRNAGVDAGAAKYGSKENASLHCDMRQDCNEPVSSVDNKGFVYCTRHGESRKSAVSCRKLTGAELKKLESGQTISY